MKSNTADDKRAERYLIVAAIIALVTLYVPAMIIGALYGWNDWSLEVEYLQNVMRMAVIAFLIAIAIVIDVSRKKEPRTRQEGHALAEVIIITVIIIHSLVIVVPTSPYIPPSHFEKIEFKDVSIAHTYTVTINFTNTGATSTSIASVLLNGIPYNDSGWVGTVKPAVTGDLTLNSVIAVGASNTGTITFSDDCIYIPSGYRFTAGVIVRITIHTTGGKDYETSVTLP
jgi:hypothetical protein